MHGATRIAQSPHGDSLVENCESPCGFQARFEEDGLIAWKGLVFLDSIASSERFHIENFGYISNESLLFPSASCRSIWLG